MGAGVGSRDRETQTRAGVVNGGDAAPWRSGRSTGVAQASQPGDLGGVFVALAARITTAADGVAGGAERVANDAARIVAGAGAFAAASAEASALASVLAENE